MFDYRLKPVKGTDSIIDSLNSFKELFNTETNHLKDLNWKGLFAAGGSVLGSLLPPSKDIGMLYPLVSNLITILQYLPLLILIYSCME
jgi:hypothetical protein